MLLLSLQKNSTMSDMSTRKIAGATVGAMLRTLELTIDRLTDVKNVAGSMIVM